MSHAAGVGNPFKKEIVRAIMALRIKDLARGHSGIRLETVLQLIRLLNASISPVVPEKGSVGASLVLLGMGEAFYKGKRLSGKEALKKCGMDPIRLEAAEGLALVNGTQVMTAIAGLAVYDSLRLSKMIDIAAAMSLEVLMGSKTEFDPRIHQLRPHPGQALAANNMDRITKNSEIITSHKDCRRIQDAYTLRCSPQVHGASKDVIEYALNVVKIEINSSTGNPLIFQETEEFLLGGNFHGQPVALAMDFLCMGVSELANISERRIERLVNPELSGIQGSCLHSTRLLPLFRKTRSSATLHVLTQFQHQQTRKIMYPWELFLRVNAGRLLKTRKTSSLLSFYVELRPWIFSPI